MQCPFASWGIENSYFYDWHLCFCFLLFQLPSASPRTSAHSGKTFLRHKLTFGAPNKASEQSVCDSKQTVNLLIRSIKQSVLLSPEGEETTKEIFVFEMGSYFPLVPCTLLCFSQPLWRLLVFMAVCKLKLLEGVSRLLWNNFETFT